MWQDLFVPGVPLLEKGIRTVLVYAFLVIGLRLAGKREMAQLNTFDLVVLLLLSNTVQNAIIGEDNSLLGGLVGATVLLVLNNILNRFAFQAHWFDRLLEGSPTTLIDNGKLIEDTCRRELITLQEIESGARKQGFDSLDQVKKAVLEPGGALVFTGNETQPEEKRFNELLQRLDQLQHDVSALRGK